MSYLNGLPKNITNKIDIKDVIDAVMLENQIKAGALNNEFNSIERLIIKYSFMLYDYKQILKYNFVTENEKNIIRNKVSYIDNKLKLLKKMSIL